ncbi:MAG: beta-hydroxyacyl-ACP dehydratase [Phycisphaeraceae bacterium]|nr:beta-hydroxyacyl-ACP dehydratase [Phycisphaeraceae bacterium]
MRFSLVDRVLERSEQKLTAIKAVTAAEEYLGDHFPSFPVLPGVLMLEAMVQAGRLFVSGGDPQIADDPRKIPLVIKEVRNVRYGNMVRPGQTLTVEVTLRQQDETSWQFEGKGTVEGQIAVQGRFTLAALEN